MQSDRESLIGRILSPAPTSGPAVPDVPPTGVPAEERGALEETGAGVPAPYTGPERRAQGYLIAEILPDTPPVDGHALQFDPPR